MFQFGVFPGDHILTTTHSQPQTPSAPTAPFPATAEGSVVIIGIDGADQQHLVDLIEPGGRSVCRTLDQDPDDIGCSRQLVVARSLRDRRRDQQGTSICRVTSNE